MSNPVNHVKMTFRALARKSASQDLHDEQDCHDFCKAAFRGIENFMRWTLQAAFLVLALAAPSLAQLKTPQTAVSECSEELFEKAQHAFQRRKFSSEMLASAERQLTQVRRLCKGTPAIYLVQDQLEVVHEEQAAHNLLVARYYLSKAFDGRGGKAGAFSRLKGIVERYPNYSQLDEVLLLLGKLNASEGKLDEAASYFQKLISTYPQSQHASEASLRLIEIEVLKR